MSTSGSLPRRVQKAQKQRTNDPIAVGDNVRFNPALGVIVEILPRRSELTRCSPSFEKHVLVANLDLLFVVVSATQPDPDPWMLDKLLVIGESPGIETAIIVNKIDLCADKADCIRELLDPYSKMGYPTFFLSALAKTGLEAVRESLSGRISAFVGASGVGKSSLLNAIDPALCLTTGDVGLKKEIGRHTTTTAQLVTLGRIGGWVADTPGLRNRVLFWQIAPSDLAWRFRDFRPYLGQCRFADCKHRKEDACEIRKAVASGAIDRRRYESYLKL